MQIKNRYGFNNRISKRLTFPYNYPNNNVTLSNYAAHARSSLRISTKTKERYNQCQNINCGATFVSHESVARFISKLREVKPVNPHLNKFQQVALAL